MIRFHIGSTQDFGVVLKLERVQSESYPECGLSANIRILKGYEMIQSHIGSTQGCGVVLRLERFSHLSDRSFGLGSPIRLEALSHYYPIRRSRKGAQTPVPMT